MASTKPPPQAPDAGFLLTLSILFFLWWLLLAIKPLDRADWLLENILVFLFATAILLSYRRFPLSKVSYTLIFLFLLLHEIGAHYTYAKVPYNQWTEQFFGFNLNASLSLERNHFDRLVHFLYGLLLAYPIREIFIRIADAKGFWGYFLPLIVAMASSMMFELFEWGAVVLFGGDLGMAYLGAQGDVWDAHKDMGLASLGALIAMIITATINISLQRDFAREWEESLKVKKAAPLGEHEIARMLRRRR